MKDYQIIRAVWAEPWLIQPAAHAAIRKLVEAHVLGARAERPPGVGYCGEHVESEQMTIADGIAHIPVGGVIGRRLGPMERGAGAVDVEDITREIAQAEADPAVEAILFDVDSPGGMVSGTPELGDRIRAATKKTYAFTAGTMASAAYWLGTSCEMIFATRSADVGSIGVYIPWMDVTESYKQQGVKVDLVKSGTFKGMGYPGTELTIEQRALLQARVDEIAAMFYGHVRQSRAVADSTMQGQVFGAEQAAKVGLIDSIVRNKAEAISLIR